ncbi:acyl-CoA synthetase [Hydrogenophaga sp. 5NK40-0174]|uniref:LpxL/LpxP family acyltransferase n=1 Tax=Hydrogenophaga sp. 5NK40-0174 TaxID=3127649 RepID=UPI00310A8BD0
MSEQQSPPDWRSRPERSNAFILRVMVWISLNLGRGISRIVLYGIALYFVVFSPKAREASQSYLRRALARPVTWRDLFRHVLSFATTIHDRVYLLNDRFDLFDIQVTGGEALRAAMARQPGVMLMGAHLGSFEALRALGRDREGIPVAMMMYAENARKINAALEAINPKATQDIIALGRPDSMLEASEKLDAGYLVGMLGDRRLSDDPSIVLPFLGQDAHWPAGPFRVAAMFRRPVFLMAGLYLGGNRYHLHFEPLADFSSVSRKDRSEAVEKARQAYVERLEHFCREAPYNWFNFFDFWQK